MLPLDQTLPVAGFTESGGDSIALIDKIYRDAGGPAPTVSLAPLPAEAPTGATKQTEPTATMTVATNDNTGPSAESGETPAAMEDDWRVWAAGSVIAGALAAWVWLTRGPEWLPTRAARRFLRALPRLATQRTA